jgi:hypothetical protein
MIDEVTNGTINFTDEIQAYHITDKEDSDPNIDIPEEVKIERQKLKD